jgi:hypothetical protein
MSDYFIDTSNEGTAGTDGTGGVDGAPPTDDSGSIAVAVDTALPSEGSQEAVVQEGTAVTVDQTTLESQATTGIGSTAVIGITTEKQKEVAFEASVPRAPLSVNDTFFQAPRALEGVITQSNNVAGKTNSQVAAILENIKQSDISPFIANLNVLKPKEHEPAKLESVGIYKTIDLISEGPIAGLCDAYGNLIPLVDGADSLNEDGLKGVYLNDVPVKNTRAGTINYQRILSEIKYGSLRQGLLKDNRQKSLSFLRSSQTFNVGITLPGLNNEQSLDFSGDGIVGNGNTNADFEPYFLKSQGSKLTHTGKGTNYTTQYEVDLWTDNSTSLDRPDGQSTIENQMITVGLEGNYASVYTGKGDDEIEMIKRMRLVFEEQPVVYHHSITNDNVSDIEINLFVDQLYLRDIGAKAAKDPVNNTLFFLVKIGYEDSDLLINNTGGDTFYAFLPVSGLCTSRYERAYNFPLPVVAEDRDRRISICLASEEPVPDAVAIGGINRKGGVATITEIVDAPLVYPHSAIMATLIDARSFSRVPKRTFDMKLLKVKIPANYDSENREYKGNWTGQWASRKQWSDNPAWVFYDMMTSRRYGLAKYGFGDDVVDKWNLYSIGKYCDELVETGYRPPNVPLLFTVDVNSATVFINDQGSGPGNAARGEEKIKGMFPEGEVVAFYKLKDESGTALNKGFRRRIGTSFYNKENNMFSFNIHKIINSEYIFMTYVGLEQLYIDFNYNKEEKKKITANAWIVNYLTEKSAKGIENDMVREYLSGYNLGSSVSTGKVVVEKDLYKPVLEPRFSTNIYLDKEQDAFNCLNDLAAIFRGMVYWNNGFVFISNDQSREAIMVFTNSNVQEGVFTYTGSAKSTRFSSVLVRYNDAQDSYKPKVEYIEDASSVRKYGYLEKKIIALGTTSRSQAYRLGKWFLYTNQLETDLIQFKCGIEATYLRPGDVIKIQDSLKNTKRYGGRIKAINPANYQITLDQGVYENVVGQKITLIVPQSSKAVTQLNADAKEKLQGQDFTGIKQSEIDETRATQIQQFTVTEVSGSDATSGGTQNDLITVEADEALSRVAVGTIWSMQNIAADYKIKEVEYRVLGVTEETAGQYALTGMMYAGSKFGAIDESRDLVSTQQSASSSNEETYADGTPWEGAESSNSMSISDTASTAGGGPAEGTEQNPQGTATIPEEDGDVKTVTLTIDFSAIAKVIRTYVAGVAQRRYPSDNFSSGISFGDAEDGFVGAGGYTSFQTSPSHVVKWHVKPSINSWAQPFQIINETKTTTTLEVPLGTHYVHYSLGYEMWDGRMWETVNSDIYRNLKSGGGD